MTAWSDDELIRIGRAEELHVASLRRDGTTRDSRIVWVIRDGDDLYVRSVNGPTAAWYRGVQTLHKGQVQAGAITRNVTFIDAEPDLGDRLDAAYRRKYHRYSATTLNRITSAEARSTTLQLVPRPTTLQRA